MVLRMFYMPFWSTSGSMEPGQPSRSSDMSQHREFQTSLAQASLAGVPFLSTGRCHHLPLKHTTRLQLPQAPMPCWGSVVFHCWQITCRITYLCPSFFSRLRPLLILDVSIESTTHTIVLLVRQHNSELHGPVYI